MFNPAGGHYWPLTWSSPCQDLPPLKTLLNYQHQVSNELYRPFTGPSKQNKLLMLHSFLQLHQAAPGLKRPQFSHKRRRSRKTFCSTAPGSTGTSSWALPPGWRRAQPGRPCPGPLTATSQPCGTTSLASGSSSTPISRPIAAGVSHKLKNTQIAGACTTDIQYQCLQWGKSSARGSEQSGSKLSSAGRSASLGRLQQWG